MKKTINILVILGVFLLLLAIGIVVLMIFVNTITYPTDGGIMGWNCGQIDGVEAQPRPTHDVLVNLETGKECSFEKSNPGFYNVLAITNRGPTGCIGECHVVEVDWAYGVGTIEPNCDGKINNSHINLVGKDQLAYWCTPEPGI